jgi:hypothetical protein
MPHDVLDINATDTNATAVTSAATIAQGCR